MFYNQELMTTMRAKNPEAKMTEISKQVGEQWGQLAENEKTKWVQLALKDKARQEKELN